MEPNRRAVLLGGMAAWLLPCQALAADPVLRIVHSDKPGGLWDPNGPSGHALGREAVEEVVGRRAGFALIFEALPWVRAQILVREGRADALLAPPTEDRLAYAKATEAPLLEIPRGIVFAADSTNSARLEAARSLSDIASLIYVYNRLDATESARAETLPDTRSAPDDATVLQILSVGRGDYTIINLASRPPGRWVAPNGKTMVSRALPGLPPVQHHLLLRRSLPDLDVSLNRIDAAIAAARSDGSLDRLLQRALREDSAGSRRR